MNQQTKPTLANILGISILMLSSSTFAFQGPFTQNNNNQNSQEHPYELTIYKKYSTSDGTYLRQIIWDIDGDNSTTSGGNNATGDWDLNRRHSEQNNNNNDDPRLFDRLLYYEIIFKTKPTTMAAVQAFSIKILNNAIVLEDHSFDIKEGIFISIDGDPSSQTVQSIGFNDSLAFDTEMDRFSPETQVLNFYSELRTRLNAHQHLTSWEDDLMYELHNTNYFPDADVCDQAIIDLLKSLVFHVQADKKSDVLTILDDIYRAQLGFTGNCSQSTTQ